MHVFDPAVPLANGAAPPPNATVDDYLPVHRAGLVVRGGGSARSPLASTSASERPRAHRIHNAPVLSNLVR
jgi:hypothetical protein